MKRQNGSQATIKSGYVLLGALHPDNPSGKRRYEHQIFMEKMLGRELLPGENVHHRNGVRFDNRPENLELWSSSQPAGQRVADKVAWAEEILALYKGIEYN